LGQTLLQLTDGNNNPKFLLYCDGPTAAGDKNVFKMDTSTGVVRFGGNGQSGVLGLYPGLLAGSFGETQSTIFLNGHTGQLQLGPLNKVGPNGITGKIMIKNTIGNNTMLLDGGDGDLICIPGSANFRGDASANYRSKASFHLDSKRGNIWLGGNDAGAGKLFIFPSDAKDINNEDLSSVRINGDSGGVELSAQKDFGGKLVSSIALNAKNSAMTLRSVDPGIDGKHFPRIDLNGQAGNVTIKNVNGNDSIVLDAPLGAVWLGSKDNDGDLMVFSKNATNYRDTTQASIHLNGGAGDILLRNADCAEEFDISSESTEHEPGTVMIIDTDGKLQRSNKAYDKRVAGVISGAGDCKPGIILDKKKSLNIRAPLAMLGKVYCKVDANQSSIKVGDMLTTSKTPGHAMKATNRSKSFGAVIGKGLGAIKSGRGLIPILVALQ
jgi:hypothetical protein